MSERTMHRDVLLSLGVGGDASERQWDQIAEEACADHGFARDFVLQTRDQVELSRELDAAMCTASRVDLPDEALRCGALREDQWAGPSAHDTAEPSLPQQHVEAHRAASGGVAGRLGGWAGWIVAACLLGGWLQIGHIGTPRDVPVRAMQTGLGTTAEDALQVYLDRGRSERSVIDELPHRVLIESRELPDGAGTEVLYLRQFIERAVVPDLYRIDGQNELGEPSLVRYMPHSGGSL